MCGRYYVDDETSREIRKILEQLDAKYQNKKRNSGEIFPTNTAPILAAYHREVEPELAVWGFLGYNKKGVLINARAETAWEKKTFRESLMYRRCVIPSNGFYEWDSKKQKFFFKRDKSDILYMAGMYCFHQEECRFVILTTSANPSMEEIHDRMPLVLEPEEIEPWVRDDSSTGRLLQKVPPFLTRSI